MSEFLVSARKYRPKTFDQVVGQSSVTSTLKNAIKTNQLPQSFLFCGPRGIGKTTCARIFAKEINIFNSTEYLVAYHKINESSTPFFDLDVEFELQQSVSSLIKEDLIISAHDVSDGGLFITLLESCMTNNLGFSINSDDNIRKDAFLFGESPSRVVVSIDNSNKKAFENLLSKSKTSFHQIGTVTEGDLLVDGELFGNVYDYKQKFNTSLSNKMS